MRPTVVAERQASAGARDGVKGKRNDLAARAPLHALVRLPRGDSVCRLARAEPQVDDGEAKAKGNTRRKRCGFVPHDQLEPRGLEKHENGREPSDAGSACQSSVREEESVPRE